jgi:hypothetical protein
MARAQKLQEWDWEMEKGHGGATNILEMAGLNVEQLMFYPHDWDLAFYSILQITVCIIVSTQCFIYLNGSWCYTTFHKWTVCMLIN